MRYFINFALKKYIFDQDMFGSAPIYDVLTSCTRPSYMYNRTIQKGNVSKTAAQGWFESLQRGSR